MIENASEQCVQVFCVEGIALRKERVVVVMSRSVAGLSHARHTLDGHLFDAVAETRETRVTSAQLVLSRFDQFFYALALLAQHQRELHVEYARIELAAHERGALVLFDVALIGALAKRDVRAEALFAEVARRIFVRIRQKVQRVVLDVIVLQVVHHVGAVAFDLLVRRNGAEHNLREALRGKHVKADATDHARLILC